MTRIERLEAIERAAVALIAAIDDSLDRRPWPIKYAVPWGQAKALRDALAVRPERLPEPEPIPYELPRGPRRK